MTECSAAIARQTDCPTLAEQADALIEALPNLVLIAVDIPLARQSANIARDHRLRCADSVYVAVPEALDAALITRDGEVLERSPAGVHALTPAQWLEQAQTHRQ